MAAWRQAEHSHLRHCPRSKEHEVCSELPVRSITLADGVSQYIFVLYRTTRWISVRVVVPITVGGSCTGFGGPLLVIDVVRDLDEIWMPVQQTATGRQERRFKDSSRNDPRDDDDDRPVHSKPLVCNSENTVLFHADSKSTNHTPWTLSPAESAGDAQSFLFRDSLFPCLTFPPRFQCSIDPNPSSPLIDHPSRPSFYSFVLSHIFNFVSRSPHRIILWGSNIMATLADHPLQATASPMPTMAANYDQDLDSFINFDQLAYTSADAVRPKVALASQPSVTSSEYARDARSASFASNGQSPIAFQAPSHHYEEHRQQTGLPPGALSMTYNQVSPMGFANGAQQGYQMNGEMMAGHIKRDDAPFDFNTAPRNPSEMDIESDSMNPAPYFLPTNPNKSQYVDPNALGGHELAQAGPSTQVGRMYPGMHQQQAAMAKAQQQKQDEMIRQQQVQHRGVEDGQNALPRSGRVSDPVLDERISRLLQHMKQTAAAAGDASPSPSAMPQMAKLKKDEADMDEDERLLASEEGKKLSSKERRQLRNKVSARAFRSRRKGMIFPITDFASFD